MALQKLLKKYRKWTGSSALGQRFRRDILSATSSLNSKFEPLVEQYIDTLAGVRGPFDTSVNWHVEPSLNHGKRSQAGQAQATPFEDAQQVSESGAGRLCALNQKGSRIELDAALATTPLGQKAYRAAYWVHPDNVVQLQILLLQHTRIRNWNSSSTSSKTTTGTRTSPRGSVSGHTNDSLNTGGYDLGSVICDDLNQFVARQEGLPIGDTELTMGSMIQKCAATIRYSSSKDLLLVVTVGSRRQKNGIQSCFRTLRFKRKSVHNLFDTSSDEECVVIDPSDDYQQYYSWLAKHPAIRPLVQIQCKRSHFIGIRNMKTSGIWATLDTEVEMRKCSQDSVSGKHQDEDALSITSGQSSESQRFPLAILEVRVEGPEPSGLVAALDASHLVG